MSTIQADIEARLAEVEPEVEVLLAEVVGGDLVRLFIDHPEGVTLELCERVTNHLPSVREKYALEVSSPGPSARSPSRSTSAASSAAAPACARAATTTASTSFTGELLGATDDGVTVAADTGVVSIAYADIHRSNLLGD